MSNKILVSLLAISFNFSLFSQAKDFKDKFDLPSQVKETSGLLFLNDKIITHNDSGDNANLYELSNTDGSVLRTVRILNATNIDWEDIAEDDSHIYIGDFGNNNGNRTDLKIYKVLKSDFDSNTSINAEIISFSYEDQTDFSSRPNNNNFDAEALIILNNNIYLFSKNWINLETRVYKIPTIPGSYSAKKVSNANVQGLITGATTINDHIFLCGYDITAPFTIFISANRSPGDNIFSNGFTRYSFINELGAGNQVEGITALDNGIFFISREESNNVFFQFTPKLFEFTDNRSLTLSLTETSNEVFDIFPNPTKKNINIETNSKINSIEIYTLIGNKVLTKHGYEEEIDISNLTHGIYLMRIKFKNKSTAIKKIIKL